MVIGTAPLASTILNITNTLALAVFLYLIIPAFRGKKFRTVIAVPLLVFVIAQIITFYIYRIKDIVASVIEMQKILGIFIGISGVITITLFIILIKLCHNYNKAEMNYIPEHKRLPIIVTILWFVTYFTGIFLYLILYVL
ncbi:MAG TPA: hypothetical protein VJB11_03320 [archaeon]|nr:hypothetical protein [archaeon]